MTTTTEELRIHILRQEAESLEARAAQQRESIVPGVTSKYAADHFEKAAAGYDAKAQKVRKHLADLEK